MDLDAWRRAHPTWSVTLDGITYRAQPVSSRAVAHASELMARGPKAQLDAMERLFRLAFPWRFSYVWTGDPVKKIMALSPADYRETVEDFFGFLGLKREESPRGTGGTNSPRSTPSQPPSEPPQAG